MRTFLSILLLAIFANSLAFANTPAVNPYDQAKLTEQLENFKKLVERNLVWRMKTTKLIISFNDRVDQAKPFLAKDIRQLSEYTIPEYKVITDQLKDIIQETQWMVDKNTTIKFSNSISDIVTTKNKKIIATLNPYDKKGTFYFLHGLNSLAASTLLTDNYLLIFSQVQSNAKLRELIRYEIPGFEDFLLDLNSEFTTIENFVSFDGSADLFENFKKFYQLSFRDNLFKTQEFAYLYEIIKNSYSLKEISKDGSYDKFKKSQKQVRKRFFSDRMKRMRSNTLYKLSKAFGNTAGSVRTRKGKLYNMPTTELKSIRDSLKPLDLLFEKTPFALTDKFIPGHFGHVALWIGSKQDLIDLGIWNHPLVQAHKKSIEAGKGIVEALRPGVQINSLKSFMNVDDLAIVRQRVAMNRDELKASILRALKQIGKDYDFNFDVETRTRIICSELVYIVFEDFDWMTSSTIGDRYTISPENVGVKAIDNGPFQTTILFHKGKRIQSKLDSYFKKLLNRNYKNLSPKLLAYPLY